MNEDQLQQSLQGLRLHNETPLDPSIIKARAAGNRSRVLAAVVAAVVVVLLAGVGLTRWSSGGNPLVNPLSPAHDPALIGVWQPVTIKDKNGTHAVGSSGFTVVLTDHRIVASSHVGGPSVDCAKYRYSGTTLRTSDCTVGIASFPGPPPPGWEVTEKAMRTTLGEVHPIRVTVTGQTLVLDDGQNHITMRKQAPTPSTPSGTRTK